MLDQLVRYVCSSDALRVSDKNKAYAYWYPKWEPSPFYFCASKTVPGETDLVARLSDILTQTSNISACAQAVEHCILTAWHSCREYQQIIRLLTEIFSVQLKDCECVVGQERKDWLFSVPIAALTSHPHLYLFKNGSVYMNASSHGRRICMITDVVNYGTHVKTQVLPVLESLGYSLNSACALLAREPEGIQLLESIGVSVNAPIILNRKFFDYIFLQGLLTISQYQNVCFYYENFTAWCKEYLENAQEHILERLRRGDMDEVNRIVGFFQQNNFDLRQRYPNLYYRIDQVLVETGWKKVIGFC